MLFHMFYVSDPNHGIVEPVTCSQLMLSHPFLTPRSRALRFSNPAPGVQLMLSNGFQNGRIPVPLGSNLQTMLFTYFLELRIS